MQRVLVIDKNKQPLMPCHPARARELLRKGKAAVFRRYPFTIILQKREGGDVQPTTFKIDPGSRQTGLVLVADFQRGKRVIWAAVLAHRGQQIKENLLSRRQIRRNRRSRKTRYRAARFNNRRKPEGWLPPSLQSRVDNICSWWGRLYRFSPITTLALELVKFDTQLMQDAEISGIEYQQGKLAGYEVREYLLQKFEHQCSYCEAKDLPLEIEHIIPKSRGGTNRVSNLTLACHACNQRKGNQTAKEFGHPEVQKQAKQPLKDTAAINAIRWMLWRRLQSTELPLEVGTGGRTKFNRTQQNYPKAHWIDAACVGKNGERVYITPNHIPLFIRVTGRQSRQMCRMDKYGFPRTKAKQNRACFGFQTGDIVKAIVPTGKYAGTHLGRVAVRRSGSFRVGQADGITYHHCRIVHRCDGYEYTKGEERHTSPR